MERLQTGQDRSSTSKIIRLNTVPAGQRYAMGMPSYFSSLSMFNAKRPSPHHHDMQGKTILAFRRIVHNYIYKYHPADYKDFPCRCGATQCCGYILAREYWGLLPKSARRSR